MIMKKLVIGLIIGLTLGFSSNVFAAVGDKVEAVFADFIFKIDGVEKKLDEKPVVINGSSYLPIRTVANLVGKDVVYKADMKTIELNTPKMEAVKGMNLAEITAAIERIDNQIVNIQKESDQYQSQIDKVIKEQVDHGLNIENDKTLLQVMNNYKGLVQSAKQNIAELERQKADLESQKAQLEAQLQ